MDEPELLRTVIWRCLFQPGAEYASLWHRPQGFRLEGEVVAAPDGRPLHLRYRVDCDGGWLTQSAELRLVQGAQQQTLRLEVDRQGRWWRDGQEVEAVRGCRDVDISLTPATNTLPIQRLRLPLGARSDLVRAAWVQIPELNIEPLPQHYTRLGHRTYFYETIAGFATDLEVDELGLVTRYHGGWERQGHGL